MVRPSAPRFLNFGDRFELPVVVQNQTDKPLKVDVALRGTGFLLTKSGQRVTVPAHDRVEVRFPAEANQSGEARFQVAGISGSYQDAAEIALPVQIPATSEAFATYGQIDEGSIIQPIQAPDKVLKQVGGLEISTSSTNLQSLTDAYIYIASYPYGCVEQISSRILTTAALRDVLSAFKGSDMPSAAEN
jgi:alpha-2-macroglobulin